MRRALTPALKSALVLSIPEGRLRPLTPDDIHAGYVAGLNDPQVNRYLVAVRQQMQTAETVRAFVDANRLDADGVLFGIWVDGQERHCGTVRLYQIDRATSAADVGICIFDRNAWGRSLGAAAIGAVTAWAFGALGLEAITAGVYAENVASWKAFIKAGYAVAEDIAGRYELDGRPVVVRKLVARRGVSERD